MDELTSAIRSYPGVGADYLWIYSPNGRFLAQIRGIGVAVVMPWLNEAETMYSPHWLFLMPGHVWIGLDFLGYGIAIPGWAFHSFTLDAHTLLSASLAILCSYQSVIFAVIIRS